MKTRCSIDARLLANGWLGLAVGTIALGLVLRLDAYGLFEPFELDSAERARRWLAGSADLEVPPLTPWLASASFRLWGVHEWSGRLPLALCGVLAIAILGGWVCRVRGLRAGLTAALVVATMTVMTLGARELCMVAPAMLGQIGVACAAFELLYAESWRSRGAWWLALVVALAIATLAAGVLMGPVPPLASLAIVLVWQRPKRLPVQARFVEWALVAGALALCAGTALAIARDAAAPSLWTGGAPFVGSPPQFDQSVERLVHALSPWTGLGAIAAVSMLWPARTTMPLETPGQEGTGTSLARSATSDSEGQLDAAASASREATLRAMVIAWMALGYGTATLFEARYGSATFLAAGAVAIAIALFLEEVVASREAWKPAALAAGLLSLLIVRDIALYPARPLLALPLAAPDLSATLGRIGWPIALGAFIVALVLALAVAPNPSAELALRAPYRGLWTLWRRGRTYRLWLATAGMLALGLLLSPLLLQLIVRPLPSIVQRVALGLAAIPLALPLAVAAAQLVVWGQSRLETLRLAPLLIVGVATGLFVAQGYLPATSEQLSPRAAFEAYVRHGRNEPIVQHGVSLRSAHYYLDAEPRSIPNLAEVVSYLTASERRWALFSDDQLPMIDRLVRQRTGQHLIVASRRGTKVLLASNRPVPGLEDHNPLATTVVRAMPAIATRAEVAFGSNLDLLGYEVRPLDGSYVGAGQRFALTWYWRARADIRQSYQVFVHIDGAGHRLNGDHTPAEGLYPTNLWDSGDIVIDRHVLTVPADFPPGRYDIHVGFFAGATRLAIDASTSQAENRANVGFLTVR